MFLRKFTHIAFSIGTKGLCTTSMAKAAQISEDTVQLVNGMKINYCTSGSGNHVVLLLPGALGTGRSDFTPQLEGALV